MPVISKVPPLLRRDIVMLRLSCCMTSILEEFSRLSYITAVPSVPSFSASKLYSSR